VAAYTGNNGLTYPPISQFDPKQYLGGTLPGYQNDDGEAAVFAMLARGADRNTGNGPFIDSFWIPEPAGSDWPGADLQDMRKITFSNGAGQDAGPSDRNALKIVAGMTDFAALLMHGPVMIGSGGPPPNAMTWLLATQLTVYGDGIVANDPATGGQVILSYDPESKTIGGIESVFDPKSNGFVPVDAANATKIAGDIGLPDGGLAALQSFAPAGYFAVTVH
jgi:hypothetical protein